MRQASPWQSRIRRAALTTFTLTRTGALIVATEFDTKKEELDKTQTELDAAKDTVTKKQAELDEAKAADEAAKQKHEELVAGNVIPSNATRLPPWTATWAGVGAAHGGPPCPSGSPGASGSWQWEAKVASPKTCLQP